MSKFALLFLAVFFGGILAALFFSGTAAFVLYQLVYFLNPDSRWWAASIPGIRYSMITVLLMMLVLLLRYKELSKLSPWTKQPVFFWLIAFLLMYYFMYLHAIDLANHKRFTIDFTKLVIIVMIAYKLITTEKGLDAVLWAYIIGASYIGYVATSVGRNNQGRVEGIGMVDSGDANGTAAALVSATPLLMYYAWVGGWKTKLLAAVMGGLIANGLVLINSRGSFLGVVAGGLYFLFFMLFSRYQRKGQRAMASLIIVAGLSGAIYVTDDAFWQRMGTMQADEHGQRGGASRTDFWWMTFRMLEDHPMGLGVFGYQRLSSAYLSEEQLASNTGDRAVHSSWFQMLSEVGYIGTLLFVVLMLSLYKQSRKTKKYLIETDNTNAYFKMLALEAALIGFCIAASFIDRIRAEILYWMILFLISAINIYYLRATQSTELRGKSRALNGRRLRRKAMIPAYREGAKG